MWAGLEFNDVGGARVHYGRGSIRSSCVTTSERGGDDDDSGATIDVGSLCGEGCSGERSCLPTRRGGRAARHTPDPSLGREDGVRPQRQVSEALPVNLAAVFTTKHAPG